MFPTERISLSGTRPRRTSRVSTQHPHRLIVANDVELDLQKVWRLPYGQLAKPIRAFSTRRVKRKTISSLWSSHRIIKRGHSCTEKDSLEEKTHTRTGPQKKKAERQNCGGGDILLSQEGDLKNTVPTYSECLQLL